MVKLLNSLYLGASTPDDYGKATGVIELLPFDLYLGAATPSGIRTLDVLLSGVSPLTLLNAISLNYIKAFGKCEQDLTPTPTTPVDIVCNNGTLKVKDDELPVGYKRTLGYSFNNDCYYVITGFKMNGSDTLRFSVKRTGSAACNVVGAYDGTSAQTNYSLYTVTTNDKYLRYNGGTYNSTLVIGTRYDVVISPTGSSGMPNNSTWTAKTFTSTNDLCIATTAITATSPKLTGDIYGNIQVDGRAKFIPCERVSDNVLGYYDTYSETFYEPYTGTPTSLGYDTSHLEVYVDGTQEVVTVASPNLLNPALVSDDNKYIAKATGVATSPSSGTFRSSPYILIEPNTQYKIAITYFTASTAGMAWYTDTNNPAEYYISGISGTAIGASDGVVTSPATAKYVRFSWRVDEDYDTDWEHTIYFCKNGLLSSFQPYVTPQTATCENLLSVGTYKDLQNITSGSVTRNVGIKVLDGKEVWADIDQYSRTSIVITDMKNSLTPRSLIAYCNYFENLHSGESISSVTAGQFYLASPQRVYFHISQSTISEWQTWLASQYAAGTPVIIVYPLATATSESVTAQTLTLTEGTNVVSAEGSVDGLELEISYKAAVTVTVEEIEAVNTDASVEVTIS